jgi:capsular exopolysaccharide synthesis family protein
LETVSLGDYVGVVWRRKWIVLIVTALFGLGAVLYAKHQKTTYTATSTVYYNPAGQASQQGGGKGQLGSGWGASMLDQADSQLFAASVIHALKLKDVTPNQLLAHVKVAASQNGNAVLWVVNYPNHDDAVKFANAFATSFPTFINPPVTKGKLAKEEIFLHNLQLEQSNPQKYGPFITMKNGKPQIFPDGYHVDTARKATLPFQIHNAEAQITQLKAAQPTAQDATSTRPSITTAAVLTKPSSKKTLIIGLVIGFVVGVLLAFLQDVLDTRIRSAEDVGRRLRVPLLARIPGVPKAAGGKLAMLAPPGSALMPTSEAYRIAKLNLTGLIERTGAKTVMFTSAGEDEGTSQTVANLAIVLARSGRHVILVDANMRESAQAKAFGLDEREGLSDILAGHGRLADALTAVEVTRPRADVDANANGHTRTEGILEILPAGSPAYDAAELLDTRTTTDLLSALRQRADVVLIDAPAMLPVTDAMVLASRVDAVVLVSRARRASRPNVVALRRALDNCPAPALGFVFTNDSSGRRNDYGGSYVPSARPYAAEEEREVSVL